MRKVHLKLARMNKMDDGISAARTPTMAEETPEEFKEIAVKVAKEPESINMLFQQNLNPEGEPFIWKGILGNPFKCRFLLHLGKKFICLLCYNHYKNKSHIKDHIRGVHLKLQLFECEFCEQKFRYKGALRVHRAKIHSTINASEADKKLVVTIIVTDHDAVIPVTMPPVAPKEPDDNNNPRTPTHSGKFCSRIASPALSKSVRKSPRKSRTASPIHVGDKDKFEFKINCSQCERKFPSPLKLKRHVSMAHYGSRRN